MAVTETRTIVLWCICSSIVDRRLYRANNNAPVDLGVEENTSETMTSVKHEIFTSPTSLMFKLHIPVAIFM